MPTRMVKLKDLVVLVKGGGEMATGVAHRLAQPGRAVLEHVIVGALLHGSDGQLFADASGNEDKGDVQFSLLNEFERPETAELRQGPVGQDKVRPGFERL